MITRAKRPDTPPVRDPNELKPWTPKPGDYWSQPYPGTSPARTMPRITAADVNRAVANLGGLHWPG